MHMHARMKFQPAIPFGFVGVEIVENDVDFACGVFRHNLIHEIEKLTASAPGIVSRFHLAGDHIQRGKQGRGSVAFIAMTEAVHGFAVGQTKITLGPL